MQLSKQLAWPALIALAACTGGSPAPPMPAQAAADVEPGQRAGVDLTQLLARYVEAAARRVPASDCLQADQQRWQVQTAQRCGADAECLASARVQRARRLEGVIPGAALERVLDAYPQDSDARLLTVTGHPHGPEDGDSPAEPLEEVVIEGVPRQAEGGFLLVDARFDAVAYAAFDALLGDEDALRARFGDGPILFEGLVGSVPARMLDVGDLAAIDAIAARGGRLRVRGWAPVAPDAAPAIDPGRCTFFDVPGDVAALDLR